MDHIPDDIPKVWTPPPALGGKFGAINRPTAGARHEQALARGDKPLQLYSMETPNGVKVAILLEELKALGVEGAAYDAHRIDIMQGEQFGSGFVAINPNSKIPALVDQSGAQPVALFESGAIMLHLAEKFGYFLPEGGAQRAQCLSWLFWQMGSAPYLGGGFGHFHVYAPERIPYAIDRFTMESKRQLSVLDQQLQGNEYLCGSEYTLADMAIWPWYGCVALGRVYDAAQFLDVPAYPNLLRWAHRIDARAAVQAGSALFK
jgi:GST-like protein